jgi:hypothetical protein
MLFVSFIAGTSPDVVKGLSNTTAALGGEAVFTVEGAGKPPPEATW